MRFRKTLYERVVERRRERFRKRAGAIASLSVMAVGLLGMGLYAYAGYKETKVESMPTWASFTKFDPRGMIESQVAVAEDGLPNTLRINGETWSVVKIGEFSEVVGKPEGPVLGEVSTAATFCANKTITYIDDQSRERLRTTIMHEVFHAGACVHGGDKWWNSENPTPKDHPGIYHLGEFMSEFAASNKQFMGWMAQ